MPHIIVKLYPGRSEEQKAQLAETITKDAVTIAKCDESPVSVAIEEVKPGDWAEKVYKQDIPGKPGTLYKRPGYNPLQRIRTQTRVAPRVHGISGFCVYDIDCRLP